MRPAKIAHSHASDLLAPLHSAPAHDDSPRDVCCTVFETRNRIPMLACAANSRRNRGTAGCTAHSAMCLCLHVLLVVNLWSENSVLARHASRKRAI